MIDSGEAFASEVAPAFSETPTFCAPRSKKAQDHLGTAGPANGLLALLPSA
jgi:hypothetical protein